MNIQEFKQQNPDYADVPDVDLADALHAKYYSDMPRAEFLQKVGVAGKGGNFSMSTDRDSYAQQFMANNPKATQSQLDAVLSQYDQKVFDSTTPPPSSPEPSRAGPRMLTDRAAFDERLNNRLNQGKAGGIVPDLPELHTTAPHTQTIAQRQLEEERHQWAVDHGQRVADLPPSNVNPQDYADQMRAREGGPGTMLSNATAGLASTLEGALGAYSSMTGAQALADDMDKARAYAAEVARQNGGDTLLGKASNLAGSVLPAMATGGAGLTTEIATNAGLFGVPAFRDTYKQQIAAGHSEGVALAHAAAAAGINTALPTIAPAGSSAVARMIGAGEADGLKGLGVSLGQAAGEGAAFNVANSVTHKGIDTINGVQNNDPWIDTAGAGSDAAAFAMLRGAHALPGAGEAALNKVAPGFQAARAISGEIGDARFDPAQTGAIATNVFSREQRQPGALAPEQTARHADDIGPSPMSRTVQPVDQAQTAAAITAAPDVDTAIAAAASGISAPSHDPHSVAAQLRTIRPPEEEAPAAPVNPETVMPDGRIEPTLGPEHGGAPHEAAPAQADIGTGGAADPVRPGPVDGERPAPAGSADVRAAPTDAVPESQGAADLVHAEPAADRQPALSGDWHEFPAETGTLGVPRAEMPQIKAEHRGAMTQFLAARGITHEHAELNPESLKPTQTEFSLDKVQKATDYEGGERSILVSKDGYILDGHHQWLASMDQGKPVKAIVLDAPIQKLLDTVREFPSAERAEGAPAQGERASWDASATEKQNLLDEQLRVASANAAKRKATAGDRMRERVKASNPFLHFLADHGVSPQDKADIGMEQGNAGNRMVPGFGQVFRRTGKRLDELALLARDAGFLTDHDIESTSDTGGTRKLAEMIQRAIAGKEVIKAPGEAERSAPSADERLLAEAHRLGVDTEGKSADEVFDAVASAHGEHEDRRERIGTDSVVEHAKVERMADQFTDAEAAVLVDPDADIPFDLDDPRTLRGRKLTDEQIDQIAWAHGEHTAPVGDREAEGHPARDAAEGAGRTEATGEGGAEPLTVGERKDDPYTKDLFGGQDLFDDIPTRPGTTEAQKETGRTAVSDLAKRLGIKHIDRRNPDQGKDVSVVGSRLLADFVAGKPAQLVGQKVETPHDLAVLAQVYRDPRFETFRVFYMKGDDVVGESGYTSRLPAAVKMPDNLLEQIRGDKARFGADGYYILHNHPSGRAEPSRADQQVTNRIDAEVRGFLGHVVIDHNEYSVIQNWGHEMFKAPHLNGKDFTAIPEMEHGLLGMRLLDHDAVARAAKALQVKDGFATLVLTNARGEVNLLVDIPIGAIRQIQGKEGRTEAKALVRRMARESGSGGDRFLVLPPDASPNAINPFRHLMADGIVRDIVTADGTSADKQGTYFGGDFMDRRMKSMKVAEDPLEGVPKPFLKRVKVDHDVYIEDEGRWSTEKVPAHIALKSVREDISTLEAMLNCMKG